MKISAIIPVLNEEKYLPNLIRDLSRQSILPDEIVVVDANSKDASVEKALNINPRIKIQKTDPNIGAQRTLGGKLAAGEILFFIDADARMEKDFLELCVSEMEKRSLDIACPIYSPYSMDEDTTIQSSQRKVRLIYHFFNKLFLVFEKISPSGAGSCIVVRNNVFIQVGGFKENLKFDDIEFIRRAARAGKFGQLQQKIYVSDRRFKRYGVASTFFVYILLSLFFVFNAFKVAEMVQYKFADYKNK